MECRERTPSVIARLMGLDTLTPPQQRPIHKQQRVLSENYLRKTDCIGVREKRSPPEPTSLSFRMLMDRHEHNFKDIFEVPIKDECCYFPFQKGKVNVNNSANGEVKITTRGLKQESTMKLSQEVRGLDADYPENLEKLISEPTNNTSLLPARIVLLKPKQRKAQQNISPSNCEDSLSNAMKQKDVSNLKFSKSLIQVLEMKELMNAMERSRYGDASFSTKREKEASEHMKHNNMRGTDRSAGKFEVATRQNSSSDSKRFLLAEVAKKHISERWKTTKRFQEAGLRASRGCSLAEMFAMPNRVGLIDGDANFCPRSSSSHVLDPLNLQETPIGSLKESSSPLHYPESETESHVHSEDSSQPRHASTFESSSQEELSSGIESPESASTHLHGLWMELEHLKSDSLEESSDGSGMNVSSDEEESIVDIVKQIRDSTGVSSTKESRDFSYIVDVVYEAGFSCENFASCFKKWHSLETPINPVLFKTLEKKYGYQTHWDKSERRLLFDRINSSLVETLTMSTESMFNSKRLSCMGKWEEIEEELWTLLDSQEKEARSENVLGMDAEWLNFNEIINTIGLEIERLLIDDLAVECMNAKII